MTTEILHTPAETAKILGISTKTLRAHTLAGRIRFVKIGTGIKRMKRAYCDKSIQSFIQSQKIRKVPPCQYTKAPKVHSTGTTSSSTVVAFSALQKSGTKKTPFASKVK